MTRKGWKLTVELPADMKKFVFKHNLDTDQITIETMKGTRVAGSVFTLGSPEQNILAISEQMGQYFREEMRSTVRMFVRQAWADSDVKVRLGCHETDEDEIDLKRLKNLRTMLVSLEKDMPPEVDRTGIKKMFDMLETSIVKHDLDLRHKKLKEVKNG